MLVKASRIPRLFGAQGLAVYPWVLIVPERLHDAALIAHEAVHCEEQKAGVIRWWLLYLMSRRFRMAAEVRAYRRQIELGGITQLQAARCLCSMYMLGISEAEAIEALRP